MLITPCRNCTERHATCHIDCEKYRAFRAEKDKQYEERKIQYIISDTIKAAKYKRIYAWRRRRGRYG